MQRETGSQGRDFASTKDTLNQTSTPMTWTDTNPSTDSSKTGFFSKLGGVFSDVTHVFTHKPDPHISQGPRNTTPGSAQLNQEIVNHPNHPSNKDRNTPNEQLKQQGRGQEKKNNLCSFENHQYFECLKLHGNTEKDCNSEHDILRKCERKYGGK